MIWNTFYRIFSQCSAQNSYRHDDNQSPEQIRQRKENTAKLHYFYIGKVYEDRLTSFQNENKKQIDSDSSYVLFFNIMPLKGIFFEVPKISACCLNHIFIEDKSG